uniref:WAP domain-containing protein n=1 Tax=Heterorhabditis bacteriophora TaxID=37862 RepID=A0A1I7W8A5_HETBA
MGICGLGALIKVWATKGVNRAIALLGRCVSTHFSVTNMLSVLLLSLPLLIPGTLARQPTCPNGQQPKVDKIGKVVQCLPGSSQSTICGMDHTCFFSGLNYMCCPSNEPSPENQPSCANPMLTVLDSHGLPLKCSPRTRQCPQTSMFCSDVGLAFICCEAMPTDVSDMKTSTMVTKRPFIKKKKVRTTRLPEETLDCPANSIGLLNQDGSRIICNSRKKCPGTNTFCHGPYKRSICCERYEYAGSILDDNVAHHEHIISRSLKGSTFVESKNPSRSNSISVALKTPGNFIIIICARIKKVDRTTLEIDNIVDSAGWIHSNEMINLNKMNKLNSAESQPRNNSDNSNNSHNNNKNSRCNIVFSTIFSKITYYRSASFKILLNTRSKVHGTRINDLSTDVVSFNEPSRTPPSELFSSQVYHTLSLDSDNCVDKRSMAQQFLIYQIRNGWPYDDRFYRPDIDAFTAEQRRDMARLHFFDN